ncbi:hypothetical protein EVAR_43243_1 [Eumeta japonica]|uniref:Uncharacterized protein n=1 Tax=Eumeta variegata TaxID=151549 RepID=A0A4C1WS57_EUMVA|nr:hypothetical protein EVAR_43243_1 [Eumeta japonica]
MGCSSPKWPVKEWRARSSSAAASGRSGHLDRSQGASGAGAGADAAGHDHRVQRRVVVCASACGARGDGSCRRGRLASSSSLAGSASCGSCSSHSSPSSSCFRFAVAISAACFFRHFVADAPRPPRTPARDKDAASSRIRCGCKEFIGVAAAPAPTPRAARTRVNSARAPMAHSLLVNTPVVILSQNDAAAALTISRCLLRKLPGACLLINVFTAGALAGRSRGRGRALSAAATCGGCYDATAVRYLSNITVKAHQRPTLRASEIINIGLLKRDDIWSLSHLPLYSRSSSVGARSASRGGRV